MKETEIERERQKPFLIHRSFEMNTKNFLRKTKIQNPSNHNQKICKSVLFFFLFLSFSLTFSARYSFYFFMLIEGRERERKNFFFLTWSAASFPCSLWRRDRLCTHTCRMVFARGGGGQREKHRKTERVRERESKAEDSLSLGKG